jgi:hypothetical protein
LWSTTHNLVRRDSVLGWIDASHVMAEIDATTLAVVDAVTGAAATVAVTGADQVEMVGVARVAATVTTAGCGRLR